MLATPPPRTSRMPWLVLALAAAFWCLDLLVLRSGTPDRLDDSWEYGLVAASLLEGRGFHTIVVHPPLWSLRDAVGHVPVLVHGPLVPMLLTPVVALFGAAAIDGVAWIAALFAALAAHRTARLALRWAPPAVALAAGLLVTLSPLMIRAVHHDIALPVGAWLLALALDAVWRERPRAVVAGVAMGLGALVRPEFLLAAPVVLAFGRAAWWRGAIAVACVVAPWGWHGFVHAGAPFFNLSSYLTIGYWRDRPGIAVMRDFALPPSAWSAALHEALPALPEKWREFLPSAAKRLLMTPTGATGALAVLGLAFGLMDRGRRLRAAGAAGLALLPLAIMTVTLYDERYLTPLLPIFATGAAFGAHQLARHAPAWARRDRLWLGALLLLVLPSAGPALHDGWSEGRIAAQRLREERVALAARSAAARAQQLVYSDTPDFVAWTLRVPTVWVSEAEYARLPEWDGAGLSPHATLDRPRRTAGDVVWFHAAEGRGAPLPGR